MANPRQKHQTRQLAYQKRFLNQMESRLRTALQEKVPNFPNLVDDEIEAFFNQIKTTVQINSKANIQICTDFVFKNISPNPSRTESFAEYLFAVCKTLSCQLGPSTYVYGLFICHNFLLFDNIQARAGDMAFLLKPYVKIMLQLAASGKTELKRRRRIALALVCLWDANDVYTSKTCTDFRRIVRKTGTLQPPFSTTLFTKQVLRQPTSPVSLPSIERGALTDPSKLAPELYALLPTFYVDAIRPGKDGNKMNWPQQISEACRNTSLPAGVQPLHAAYDVGKTQDDNEKRHRVSMEWPEFNKFYNYSKYMYGMEDTERNSYRNAYGSAYGYVPPQRRSSTFQFGNRGSISVPNPQRRSQFAQSSYNQSRTMPTSYGPPAYSSPSTQYPLGATVQGHNQHAMGGSDSYGQDQGFGGGYNYTQGRGQGGGGGFYNPGQGQGGGNGYGRGQGQGGGYNRGATGNFQPRGNHFHQGPGAYGGYNSRGGYSNQQGHGQGGNGRARVRRNRGRGYY